MMLDPYSYEREKELGTEKALAAAEKARLAKLAKGQKEAGRWHLPATMAAALHSLKATLLRQRRAARPESAGRREEGASNRPTARPLPR
jgi:hypothetical protein